MCGQHLQTELESHRIASFFECVVQAQKVSALPYDSVKAALPFLNFQKASFKITLWFQKKRMTLAGSTLGKLQETGLSSVSFQLSLLTSDSHSPTPKHQGFHAGLRSFKRLHSKGSCALARFFCPLHMPFGLCTQLRCSVDNITSRYSAVVKNLGSETKQIL